MKRTAYLGSSLLVMMVLLIPNFAWAQADGDAYRAYYAEENPAQRAALGEKFLQDFKTSTYTDAVYRQTVSAYYQLNNFQKVVALAEKVEDYSPSATPPQKAKVYAMGMDAAQKLNNASLAVTYADRVLKVAPEDLNALITLASTLSVTAPQDKAAQEKAEAAATKGLGVLGKMAGADVGLSDADWAKQKVAIAGTLHSTLGSIYFNRGDYDKAVESMTEATKATPKDGGAWYILGLAVNQQAQAAIKKYTASVDQTNTMIKNRADSLAIEESKATTEALQEVARAKRDEAMDALATSVACAGPTAQPAKSQLDKLYQQKNGSMDGLDQLITQKQAWVKGLPN
jgi:tetratricopeptide (TPR) repeat protein